jgi:hypothetical protein
MELETCYIKLAANVPGLSAVLVSLCLLLPGFLLAAQR